MQLWNMAYPGIYISSSSGSFFSDTSQALQKIALLTLGHDLLTIISKRSQGIGTKNPVKCVIRKGPNTLMSQMGPFAYRTKSVTKRLKSDLSNTDDVAYNNTITTRREVPGKPYTLPGIGVSSVAMFDHGIDFTAALDGLQTPAYIGLAHELIHCMHYMSGDTNRYSTDKDWAPGDTYDKHEEARTVGLGPYKNTRLSENSLRKEAKLPLRPYYNTPGDCDDLTAVVK